MRTMTKPKAKGRKAGEGHVRKHNRGGYEARLYVPAKLRHLYGGKRELSFYGKTAEVAMEKRTIGQRDLDERRGRAGGQSFGTYLSR